jgi:hypothetical protein
MEESESLHESMGIRLEAIRDASLWHNEYQHRFVVFA